MRGQFYSVIAIAITIPIVIFIGYYVMTQGGETGVYETIVADQIHQIDMSIEKDFEKAVVTSGKRALIAGDDYVIMSGSPLSDAISGIKELMENGTLEGNESMLMINNTLINWTNKILSVPVNFDVNITFDDFQISLYDAFNINSSATINVSVADQLGIARIEKKDMRYDTLIPVENAEDPIFTLKTNGVLTRSVKISPYPYRGKKLTVGGSNSSGNCSGDITFNKSDCSSKILVAENITGVSYVCFSGFVIDDSVNLTSNSDCYVTGNSSATSIINQTVLTTGYGKIYIDEITNSAWHLPIREDIDNGYYFAGNGPDFLKRLEGDLNSSGNGMETFVNLPEFQSYELPIKNNVISLAYIYFRDQDYIGYPVRGLQSWFRTNKTFADQHGITELCEGC